MLLSALIDRFVPDGFGDSPDLRRRARVLIGGALAFFMASASLATLGAVTVMAVNSYTLGGVRGSTLSLALVLCVSIHFLAGARVASFWTAVCALLIAGLVGLSMTGHAFPMALDDQSGPLMAGVAILVQLGVVHAVSWLYDTERNRATQALDLALAEAEHANGELREGLAALETFARTASHDLRGPAARTQMMIDFLLEEHGESVDDDVRDWLGRIRGESERMRELIDDVLEFERSKLAEGLFEPFVRLHSPKDFAGNSVGLATVHRLAVRHGGFVRAESRPGAGATFTVSFGPG